MGHGLGARLLTAGLLSLLTVGSGCGDDDTRPVSIPTATQTPTRARTATPTPSPSQLVASIAVIHNSIEPLQPDAGARRVPPDVQEFVFNGRSVSGALQYGPVVRPKAHTVVLDDVPRAVVSLQIDYRTAAAVRVATFVTSMDLTMGQGSIVDPAFVDTTDPVVFSFVSFGCNRVSNDALASNSPSSANVGQLVTDFAEIADGAHLSPTPSYVFFTGDLVLNLEPGTATLTSQLQAWKTLYMTTPLASSDIPLVAIAGNHEMLVEYEVTPTPTGTPSGDVGAAAGDDTGTVTTVKIEVPNPPTGAVFASEMSAFIPAANGPTQAPPNLDGVQRDESMLSFTFRDGPNFFMALNTDTYIGGDTPEVTGDVPLNWIAEQLAAANSDPTVSNIFVFGHRPVDSPDPSNMGINATQAVDFYNLLAAPNGTGTATKVRAYVCAHAHLWQQGVPGNAPPGSTIPQVIAGNGGSEISSAFVPPTSYGYSVLAVTQNGAVTLESWGRPIPTPYAAPTPQPTTTLRELLTLYAPPTP